MSNFGALTTAFTPSAGCSATNIYLYATEGRQTYIQAPTDIEHCFPPGYDPEVQAGYFSPAQCPVGYTAACISLSTIDDDVETVITCCPSYASTMFACNEPDDRYPWQSSLGCGSAFWPVVTLSSISVSMDGIVGFLSQTVESTGGMNAYSVQVRLKSGDFPTVTTVTTTVTSTLPVPTVTTVITTVTSTLPVPGVTTTLPARDIDLLSPSAFAGAGLSAAMIGLVAGFGSFAYYCVRRSNSKRVPCDRLISPNSPEGPLLADGSPSYGTIGSSTTRGRTPPPPYSSGEASSRA